MACLTQDIPCTSQMLVSTARARRAEFVSRNLAYVDRSRRLSTRALTDCGGTCPRCEVSAACNEADDCQTYVCVGGTCLTPYPTGVPTPLPTSANCASVHPLEVPVGGQSGVSCEV